MLIVSLTSASCPGKLQFLGHSQEYFVGQSRILYWVKFLGQPWKMRWVKFLGQSQEKIVEFSFWVSQEKCVE